MTTDNSHLVTVNAGTYLAGQFSEDIARFRDGTGIMSGYGNLDRESGGLYPGLYVLGAISSLGKTTFMHQMCDQVAASGHKVMYFTLEQTKLELVSKSLARHMASERGHERFTSLEIRNGRECQALTDAIEEYNKYAGNITFAEGRYGVTVSEISRAVTEHIKTCGERPVVMIDYLQLVKADDKKLPEREQVDAVIQELKQLQADNGLVVIVISSFNRQNYMTQIDFESFKESGGIEYQADVVWGLQLAVIHDELFDQQNRINEKREAVRKAKAASPRDIELVCLKNRFGVSSYACSFDYEPQSDYFREAELPFK